MRLQVGRALRLGAGQVDLDDDAGAARRLDGGGLRELELREFDADLPDRRRLGGVARVGLRLLRRGERGDRHRELAHFDALGVLHRHRPH